MKLNKLIIVIIMILVCGISTQAKAIEINLGKPIAYGMELNDTSWLIMTQQQIDNMELVYRDAGLNNEIRMYKTMKYNNPLNLKAVDIYFNAPVINEEMILDMYYAYDTAIINGDAPNQILDTVVARYKDGTTQQCGVVQFNAGERIVGVVTWQNHIKCVINKQVQDIYITYSQATSPDNTDRQQYVSEISVVKSGTQQEIAETQKEIEEGIKTQNELIENTFTTGYDTELPSDNFYEYMVQQENELMEDIENMSANMLAHEIDTTANTTIWTWANRFININSKVFTLYMIVLSLGIVKLMLGR